jgi:hypothetical protein
MFSFFKKKPKPNNQDFEAFSIMFLHEEENPIYKRELLDIEKLDFSIDSLKHVDSYLEVIHSSPPEDEELMKIALRAGAYVGEVIRKNTSETYNWLEYEQALKANDLVKQIGKQVGTVGVLWNEPDSITFPIAKILKFIENGNEDSVYSFAKVACEGFPKA